MKIPNNFKEQIGKAFYDKSISKIVVSSPVDDEGWISGGKTSVSSSFYGNVRFDNLAEIRENYGIEEVIDIVITTNEVISIGEVLEYESVLYRVVKAIPYDSHNLLLAKKWLYQSSI